MVVFFSEQAEAHPDLKKAKMKVTRKHNDHCNVIFKKYIFGVILEQKGI